MKRSRARREKPKAMKRSDAVGSSVARKFGSRKTELASSKDTPCFARSTGFVLVPLEVAER